KENLKQILVFVPAVVYNIFVVLFSCQVNYITQKRICPACELQILLCRLGDFFHAPVYWQGDKQRDQFPPNALFALGHFRAAPVYLRPR
ncbi:MAG: hypothetical protein PUH81_07135, partial [Clostridiales bacterium]|nr:hypothetical protein [Clostridiales bacterium]MDY5469672.1 hypothetical protein [Eubacteriales bacterium]